MDQSRWIVTAAAAISLAVSVFAVGAGVSSDDDGSAEPTESVDDSSPAAPPSASSGTDTTSAAGSEAPAGETVDVAIAGFKFNEGEPVTIAVGTEVVWTNEDAMDHTVEFDANTGIEPSPTLAQGDTYRFTFTEPGTYDYICGIHPRMKGTIVVEA